MKGASFTARSFGVPQDDSDSEYNTLRDAGNCRDSIPPDHPDRRHPRVPEPWVAGRRTRRRVAFDPHVVWLVAEPARHAADGVDARVPLRQRAEWPDRVGDRRGA